MAGFDWMDGWVCFSDWVFGMAIEWEWEWDSIRMECFSWQTLASKSFTSWSLDMDQT